MIKLSLLLLTSFLFIGCGETNYSLYSTNQGEKTQALYKINNDTGETWILQGDLTEVTATNAAAQYFQGWKLVKSHAEAKAEALKR
ncbi:MAG: hypothetical protein SH807_07825 [Blastochloris sp.]|jgi:hypothetical protein|nr:hypothetical protein [Blastochloris sp.]